MAEEDRLRRVHVVGARAVDKGYVVVLSDPEIDAAGRPVAKPDTWEVPWSAWIEAGADVARL